MIKNLIPYYNVRFLLIKNTFFINSLFSLKFSSHIKSIALNFNKTYQTPLFSAKAEAFSVFEALSVFSFNQA